MGELGGGGVGGWWIEGVSTGVLSTCRKEDGNVLSRGCFTCSLPCAQATEHGIRLGPTGLPLPPNNN